MGHISWRTMKIISCLFTLVHVIWHLCKSHFETWKAAWKGLKWAAFEFVPLKFTCWRKPKRVRRSEILFAGSPHPSLWSRGLWPWEAKQIELGPSKHWRPRWPPTQAYKRNCLKKPAIFSHQEWANLVTLLLFLRDSFEILLPMLPGFHSLRSIPM